MSRLAELQPLRQRDCATSAPQWRAFVELGFRPLYLAGCGWAALSIALWIYAPQWLVAPLGGVAWHAHEMLWGFVATIAVGFLLTAASNWTGVNPLQGAPLAMLCALWVIARVGFLVPDATAYLLAALSELAFFGTAALALARSVYGTRNRRNYGVPLMVLALGIADALYLAAVRQGDYVGLMVHFHTGLLCMAVIALLIARRVIPFFAMRAVQGLSIPMSTIAGQWQIGAAVLAIFGTLMQWPQLAASALAVAGTLAFAQVMAWKPWRVRHHPLLWILYAGYCGLGSGLLVAAAHALGWIVRIAWPAHVIGMAGFAVLIIGMVTRTALGHLGRPLQTDRGMVASFVLVIAAAGLRLLALEALPFGPAALHAAALAWIAAFALYLWRFFPMLIRPRLS
ncbi:MAG: NnrS family protein [Betaproteobacteria bacterium]